MERETFGSMGNGLAANTLPAEALVQRLYFQIMCLCCHPNGGSQTNKSAMFDDRVCSPLYPITIVQAVPLVGIFLCIFLTIVYTILASNRFKLGGKGH